MNARPWMASAAFLLVPLRAGAAPFTDYRGQKPGKVHRIRPQDLPAPYATGAARNASTLVARPAGAWPRAPEGFTVGLYASGLDNPRQIRTAPNGDLFVAESEPGRIKVLRGLSKDGRPEKTEVFAAGLKLPYGIAFYPPGPEPRFVYVGTPGAVVRFPYKNGDLEAREPPETVVALPAGARLGGGGHWARDLAFSLDGKKLYIGVGSRSNVNDTDGNPAETRRADILEADPSGNALRVHAWGLRNPSSLAVDPRTGALWASVCERDDLGDDLPPDFITRVRKGGFYGWPWFYIGGNQDPRHPRKHPELKARVVVPDVLVGPHMTPLGLAFYEGRMFPAGYRGELFASLHGSWNRSARNGYEVIRVPLEDGRAGGEYQDFLTGFVTPEGKVWGRPVGVAVAADGALMVTDDGSGSVWRVSYEGR